MTNNTEATFEKSVKFNYFGIGAGYGTIAFQIDINRTTSHRTVRFGYALCSPKDQFSKGDLFKTVLGPIERDENGRPTNLTNREKTQVKVHDGGRSLALRGKHGLETNPVIMDLEVPEGRNAINFAIEQMQNYIYDHAPRWKNQTKLRVLRSGAVQLSRDGFELRWADPNQENLISFRDGLGEYVI